MTNLNMPIPRNFAPGETEAGAFFNGIRDALNALLNPPHFKGSITAATALATGANIAFPSVEDNYSGLDATNHWWKVPPTWGGLYTVSVQFKWGSTGPTSAPAIKVLGGASNATGLLTSPNAPSLSSFQGISTFHFIRVNAGDEISVQLVGAGFTTQSDPPADNNFFDIGFYSQ